MGSAVLIVDDDVNAQIITETLLRLRGLDVRVTTDPADAADIIAREEVGVVVVDLNMPGMNGFEGLRRLRAAFGGRVVPPRIITVIDWVMKSEGVSFRHAVELLRADVPATTKRCTAMTWHSHKTRIMFSHGAGAA